MPAASLTRLRGVGDRPARLGLARAGLVHAAGRLARATAPYHDGVPERVTDYALPDIGDGSPYLPDAQVVEGLAYRTGRTGDET
jgi:hypothetical protein